MLVLIYLSFPFYLVFLSIRAGHYQICVCNICNNNEHFDALHVHLKQYFDNLNMYCSLNFILIGLRYRHNIIVLYGLHAINQIIFSFILIRLIVLSLYLSLVTDNQTVIVQNIN